MSLARHSAINLLGNVVPMAVSLVTVPLYLGYIGAERYGVLAILWALMGYFGFIDFGFGKAVAQRMARLTVEKDSERSTLLWTALASTFLLGILGSLLLWISADYILANVVEMPDSYRDEAGATVVWLLLIFPVVLPASVLQGALQARLRFIELNVTMVLGTTLYQLIPLGVAASGLIELQYLVPAALVSRVFTIILLFRHCRRYVPLSASPRFDPMHLKPLMQYGGWISVMYMLTPLLATVDRFFIAALSGVKSVAHYTVPFELVNKLGVMAGSLSSAIFPRLAAAEDENARELALRSTDILVAILTPIVIIGLILVQPFLVAWVGRDFAAHSHGVAEIILLGVWINAFVISHHTRLLATANPKIVVIIYLIEIPVYLLLLWVGLTYLGIMGAAIAWSLRVLIDAVIILHIASVLVHTTRSMLPSFLMVGIAALVSMMTDPLNLQRWLLGLAMLVLAVYKNRKELISLLYIFRGKDIATDR